MNLMKYIFDLSRPSLGVFLILFFNDKIFAVPGNGQPFPLKLQFVGIFSICGNNYTENELSRQAFFANATLQLAYLNGRKDIFEYHDYFSFDVCFNKTAVVSLVEYLLLHEKFYTTDNEKFRYMTRTTMDRREIDASRMTKITTLITYVQEEPLQLILDVFSITRVVITKHSNLVQSNSYMKNHKHFIDMEVKVDDIKNYFLSEKVDGKRRWDDVILMYDGVDDSISLELTYKSVVGMFGELDEMCLKVSVLSITEFDFPFNVMEELLLKGVSLDEERLIFYIGETEPTSLSLFFLENVTMAFPFNTSCSYTRECIPFIYFDTYPRENNQSRCS